MSKTYTESPDQWCVIKITTDGKVNYKVFGSWIGGYTGGDAWRMNSGIASIEEEDDYYYFSGFSGSCYRCHKNTYGAGTSYTRGILENIFEHNQNNQSHWKTELELMDANIDWLNLIEK
jgi:hypothetical protein